MYKDVAILFISSSKSKLLTFIPIPITTKFLFSKSKHNSVNIPHSFLLFKIISLGHFIPTFTFRLSNTLAILTDVNIVKNDNLFNDILGFNIRNIIFGEI